MIGDELAIEQPEAADPQPCHQPGKRDLRCVTFAAEHAFAEECAAQRYAI